MYYAFYNCSNLGAVRLGDIDDRYADSMTTMFYNCNSLTSIYCDWVKGDKPNLERYAPWGATNAKVYDKNRDLIYPKGSSDDGSNADYVVSNASNSLADGEYYLTTETYADYPVYKNANGYVIYMTSSYGWCIAPAVGQAPTHGAQGNFDPVPPTTGWYGNVTVTQG
jgi:hypothetical protein